VFAVSLLGGCATVAVYEGETAGEIALTRPQTELHAAADRFCEDARAAGWAQGETSIGSLARMLAGRPVEAGSYLRWAETDPAAMVQSRLRSDARSAGESLTRLNALARKLLAAGAPGREDVTQFERVLIHAGQARETFAAALATLNARRAANARELGRPAPAELSAAVELATLDAAFAEAKLLADDLAAARAAGAVASLGGAAGLVAASFAPARR
jgi:hypothetical protein